MTEAPQTIDTSDATTNIEAPAGSDHATPESTPAINLITQSDEAHEPTGANRGVEPQMIPLNELSVSAENVRKMKPTGIEELAANIHAYGLLQNLVITETKNGKKIVAGKRRYLALSLLVKRKLISPDALIPCKAVAADNLIATSLSENNQREAMHPADEFTAWAKLHQSGLSIEEISANNGVSPIVIKRRLRLANASPKLFKLFRTNKLSLENLMAFCATDDRKRQEFVFDNLPEWNMRPDAIRSHLSEESVSGDSPVAIYVGQKDYQDAGGAITTDLFANQQGAGALQFDNPELLQRLFQEKAQTVADEYMAKDWKWAMVAQDRSDTSRMSHRLAPSRRRPSNAEQKAIAKKDEQIRDLSQQMEADELSEEEYATLEHAYDTATVEATALDEALDKYTKKQMAVSGAILTANQLGQITASLGWVIHEDAEAARAITKPKTPPKGQEADNDESDGDGTGRTPDRSTSGGNSDPLCQRLSTWRTLCLRNALTNSPALAKRFMIIKLAQSVSLIDYQSRTDNVEVLKIHANCSNEPAGAAPDLIDSKLYKQVNTVQSEWMEIFESLDGDEAVKAILELSDEKADELLAFIVGQSVDVVTNKGMPEDLQPGKEMAKALGMSIAEHWQPTAESYFSHLTRAQIAETVAQFAPDKVASLKGLNKRDTAQAAEKLVSGTGWMPVFMQS